MDITTNVSKLFTHLTGVSRHRRVQGSILGENKLFLTKIDLIVGILIIMLAHNVEKNLKNNSDD